MDEAEPTEEELNKMMHDVAHALADGTPDAPTVVIGRKELDRLRACESTLLKISAARRRMSDGPYIWGIFEAGPEQRDRINRSFDKGSGDAHMVCLPSHPNSTVGPDPQRPIEMVHLCMTGNGPASKENACGLVEILERIRWWEQTNGAEVKV